MNTIVGNKYLDVFSNLDIEVSKKLEGEYDVEDIISSFENFFFNKMFLDITSVNDYKDLSNMQKLSMGIDMDKVIILLDRDDAISSSNEFLSKLVSMGIYNFTKDSNDLMYLYNNPNSYKDVAYLQGLDDDIDIKEDTDLVSLDSPINKKILGIKNITDSAGSTTLVYLLKKILSDYYSTMAIEVDKRDLIYFNDEECVSVKEDELESTINKYDAVDLFVIDLNKSNREDLCTDVIYLIEPSLIKLNKIMFVNPKVFSEYKDKMVVLNKCLLDRDDIASFEVETGINIYYTISPLNDREDNSSKLLPLLEKLGYVKSTYDDSDTSGKKSIFGLFRRNN